MKALRVSVIIYLVATIGHIMGASPQAPRATPDLFIAAVVVQLDVSVVVLDADSGKPIHGTVVALTRSEGAALFTPADSTGSVETQKTDSRGRAQLIVRFPGNLCSCGWVEAYPGNSSFSATAPKYTAGRAWVSTPKNRLSTETVANGKVAIQLLDTLRFQGNDARRKIAYRIMLHRAPKA